MFAPATEDDMPLLRRLIRDGALAGSFDAALMHDGAEAELFFDNLKHAITTGVWQRPGANGVPVECAAHVLMYRLPASVEPVGFVALRGIGRLGYELWLTAISSALFGQGIGYRMLAEFLTTAPGLRTTIAQCDKKAEGANSCAAILRAHGFKVVRVGQFSMWLTSPLLPREVIEWMQKMPFTSFDR